MAEIIEESIEATQESFGAFIMNISQLPEDISDSFSSGHLVGHSTRLIWQIACIVYINLICML